ncbi:MAG TPA: MBL fold metallo-hydrolase, partial [Steroidobacteraceae bacterium]|nr:MBL fold metallo-hydrolase [Steroidobacteraceae bacterium]
PPQSAGASAMHRSHDNDTSCVLEIRTGAHRVLLTGDIEANAEAELERAGLLAPATLVVAPHHGSRTSSTAAFVAATRPDLVVFAAGHRNRWGFPKPDVEQRWRDVGAATLGTAESGAITLRLGPDGPRSLDAYRLSDRRYWRR